MEGGGSQDQVRDNNVRYHDLAAAHYDTKWGISYGFQGQAQVVGKLHKALGREPDGFGRGLEIGAGTGYFGLNLLRAGVLREAVATDVSPGMLAVLDDSAAELGLPVTTRVCEAAELPFGDGSFDLVFGHAVLHHLPDLAAAFREFRRVLRPGGQVAFCGEPSLYGDRLAQWPKRGAYALSPLWRRALRARARSARRPGWSGRSTCMRSRPPTWRATRAPRGLPTCACRARSWRPACSAGSTARWRAPPNPSGCRAPGTTTRTAATWRCSAWTVRCSRAGCRPRCSTTCWSRRAPRVRSAPARAWRPARAAPSRRPGRAAS